MFAELKVQVVCDPQGGQHSDKWICPTLDKMPLKHLGPVVQSIVSLKSSLVVKILTVLVSTISNSHVFLLKKNVSSFCKSYPHFFQENWLCWGFTTCQPLSVTLCHLQEKERREIEEVVEEIEEVVEEMKEMDSREGGKWMKVKK